MNSKSDNKEWYHSNTLQVNLVTFLGAASALASGSMSKETALTAMVMAVFNVILRIKTNSSIGGNLPPERN